MNERDHQAFNGQFDEALLTAYALGELQGDELALVESVLQTSPEACRAVEEIRTVAGCIREAASQDEPFAPSPPLRQRIEAHFDQLAPRPAPGPADERGRSRSARRWWIVFAAASAAVLLLAVAIPSLPVFQRGTPTKVAIDLTPMDRAESPTGKPAATAGSGAIASAPSPGEVRILKDKEPAEETAAATPLASPAANGPAAPHRADFSMKSTGAYAPDSQKADADAFKGAPMLKTPLTSPAPAAAPQETPPDGLRGRGAAPAETPGALAELRRGTAAAKAKSEQVERYRTPGQPQADRPEPPASKKSESNAAGDRLSQANRQAAVEGQSAGRPIAQAEPQPSYASTPKSAAQPMPAVEMQQLHERLDVAIDRKPQAKQGLAGTAATPFGVSASKLAPRQVTITAESDSSGTRRETLLGGALAGQQPAQRAPARPLATQVAGGKAGQGPIASSGRAMAEKSQVAPPQAAPAAPPGMPVPPAAAPGGGRAGGFAYGQAGGGGYGGFGGAGREAEAKKEDAYYLQIQPPHAAYDAEQYEAPVENSFESPAVEPESTVSIDVDTASYANVRRLLQNNQVPPPAAVRIEEMVNYFPYHYPQPKPDQPFSVDMEAAACPWNGHNRLVRVALKAKEIAPDQRGPSNLVFLLDVSGSMRDANKLPLVKDAMAMLVDQLTEDDRVSIVTYAGEAGLVLESTEGTRRKQILEQIESLKAGGSTHGSAGIQMAYDQALAHFVPGGNNRVILCTDGDLNVGVTDDDELVKLIQQKASSGVFLTVVGFGTGNLKDAKLEKLADKGNGTYAYVDGLREARKVFAQQLSGKLVTVAKDVKIQVEFNPAEVAGYRLLGYENRLLASQDFSDDMKDAGEMGAGDSITFFYEIVPARGSQQQTADLAQSRANLRYQRLAGNELTPEAKSGELLTLKLRYKLPDEQQSRLLEFPVKDTGKSFGQASKEFRFAAAVASFGLLLRGSQYNQGLTFTAVEEFAAGAATDDPMGLRGEFVDLVRQARTLYGESPPAAAAAAPAMQPADQAPAPR